MALIISRCFSYYPNFETAPIIATNTPDGGGFARDPQRFLREGEVLETSIEGLGTLSNRVVAETLSPSANMTTEDSRQAASVVSS